MNLLRKMWNDDQGQDLVEYALIAGLIAIVALFVYINSSWKSTLLNRLNNAASAS